MEQPPCVLRGSTQVPQAQSMCSDNQAATWKKVIAAPHPHQAQSILAWEWCPGPRVTKVAHAGHGRWGRADLWGPIPRFVPGKNNEVSFRCLRLGRSPVSWVVSGTFLTSLSLGFHLPKRPSNNVISQGSSKDKRKQWMQTEALL